MNLKEYKPHFDHCLETRLNEKLASVKSLFPDDETFELLQYLKPYVDHGKRFRPYMVYLRYTMHGGEDIEYITKIGLINELIHIFALIHDDICDQGTARHRIPTYHEHLKTRYASDSEHTGISQSLLVGDLVYTWAMQEASQHLSGTPANEIIFAMLNEVVIGQMLDVEYSAESTMRSAEIIAEKDHLKSGQYTFQKPMMIGASLAGVQDLSQIESLGKTIGIAFQMRDDLLDRLPNKEGKTKMSDIQEGNQTIVMSVCREQYNPDALQRLEQARGKQLSASELALLQEDFATFSIQEKVSVSINSLLDTVETDFHTLVPESDAKKDFLGVVELLREMG